MDTSICFFTGLEEGHLWGLQKSGEVSDVDWSMSGSSSELGSLWPSVASLSIVHMLRLRLACCGLGASSASVPVHGVRHGPGLEGLSLLFLRKIPQLCHNLCLPLPPLSLQEMERLWWSSSRGLVASGVAVITAASAPVRSLTRATADDFVERKVYVCRCRWCPELFLAFSELLQLPSQQHVLQLDLRACPHFVFLSLLLSEHHLEGFGHSDLWARPNPDPSVTGQFSLRFWTQGLGLESKLLLGRHFFWAQQGVSGKK